MNDEINSFLSDLVFYQNMNLVNVQEQVNNIIKYNIIDDKIIEKAFDSILDLAFWYGDEINCLFYKLFYFYKNVDIDVSNDYESYYKRILKKEL